MKLESPIKFSDKFVLFPNQIINKSIALYICFLIILTLRINLTFNAKDSLNSLKIFN